jgi:hypothetical protein
MKSAEQILVYTSHDNTNIHQNPLLFSPLFYTVYTFVLSFKIFTTAEDKSSSRGRYKRAPKC